MPPPAIPDKIPCDTEYQLERELETLRATLDQEETEDTWEPQQRALARFKALVRGGAYRHESFVPGIKSLCRIISAPMLSERGRLSAVAIEVVSTLASALGRRFDPLMQGLAPSLMKLCQRPNKVVMARAQGCLTMVIKQTRLPSIFPYLRDSIKDKSVQLRKIASEAVYVCITHIEPDQIGNKVADIETILKSAGRDASPEVRKHAKAIMQEYREKFPERYTIFVNPLTPTTRKYLDVGKLPAQIPKPLDLSGPQFKQVPPQSATSSHFPERPPSSASTRGPSKKHNPLFSHSQAALSSESLPPRPHSVASVRSRPAPFSHTPPVAPAARTRENLAPRPISVHIMGQNVPHSTNGIERPRSLFLGSTQRVEPPRMESTITVPLSKGASTQPTGKYQESQRTYTELDPRQRQRSISVSKGREEADRALRATNGMMASKPSRPQLAEGTVDYHPRPPFAAGGPSNVRSKPAMTMRKYGEVLGGTNSRPVSAALEDLEAPKPHEPEIVDHVPPPAPSSTVSESIHPAPPSKTPTTASTRPPIPLPTRTPHGPIERPQVVYLDPSEVESQPAPTRPRSQKTWSLSHQLELLNRRKKANQGKAETEAAKETTPEMEPVASPVSKNIASGLTDDTLAVGNDPLVDRGDANGKRGEPISAQETAAQVQEATFDPPATSLGETARRAAPGGEVPIVFPPVECKEETTASMSPVEKSGPPQVITETSSQAAPLIPSASTKSVLSAAPEAPLSQVAAATTKKSSVVHAKAPIPSTTGVPSGSSRARTISTSSKASVPSTRNRTISASSKETTKVPVRVPSRNAQAGAFVPKRGRTNSVTQPTKSQAARAQAVRSEKALSNPPVAKALATSTTSTASSQVSTARKPMNGKYLPTTKAQKAAESNKGQAPPTAESKLRVREGPHKPPVPTASSLVKSHAAKREVGLSQVALRLGAPTTNGAKPTNVKAKTKAVAAPVKKVGISLQERQPFKPRSNLASSTSSKQGAGTSVSTPRDTHGDGQEGSEQQGSEDTGASRGGPDG